MVEKLVLEEIEYETYGKCIRISNGRVELVITVEMGPRVICYAYCGEENVLFEDPARKIEEQGEEFQVFNRDSWKMYGGHRLWTSPEERPRTYYPDNHPVEWRETSTGVQFLAPVELWTGIQKEIEIALDSQSTKVTVHHRITNKGAWPISFSIWALTVMAPGGIEIIPHRNQETGLLPNRVLSLWPYSRMNDPRVTWGDRLILLKQDPALPKFKFGTNNEQGWAAYQRGRDLFVKKYTHEVNGNYPDYGASFETFTNESFLEIETLSTLQTVQPNETVSHEEKWMLCRDIQLSLEDESKLDKEIGEVLVKFFLR